MAIRSADAEWKGNLQEGAGQVRLGSGSFDGPYSFGSRFQEASGTNPEELIAAAHAGCFSMSLSAALSRAGTPPNRISTTSRVHLEKVGEGFKITRSELTTEGEVPGIDQQAFTEAAEGAKANCPVSQALTGVEITLEAKLVG